MDKPVANMVLAPCPFCGAAGDDLMVFCDPVEGADNSGASRRIQCAGCNIEASFYDSKAEAIAAWNRRTQPSLEGEVGEMIERLRKRYTAEPVPPCSVCGLPMSIQSAGGGNATVYGCEAHRPFDWKHYEQSRWTKYRPGDEDVLAAAALLQSLSADNARLRASLIDAASWVDECYRAWGPQGIREPTAEPYSDGVPSRMGAIRAAIGGGRQALSEGEQT